MLYDVVVPPLQPQELFNRAFVKSIAHYACRCPGDDCVRWDVASYHRVRADYRAVADGCSSHNCCSATNPHVVADSHQSCAVNINRRGMFYDDRMSREPI